MKSIVKKLTMCIVTLIIAISLILTATFAWVILSRSPEVSGIQISLGGGQTILVAPNRSETVDGVKYNYPGAFSDRINFNKNREYAYLNELAGLTPVSTADGLHWFLPAYYEDNDPEVINGNAAAGTIKPIESFILDRSLANANLTDGKRLQEGSYVYLDFWIVAPGGDYDLRISRGDSETGSFLLELTSPTENEQGEYELKMSAGSVAASARVGFLVDNSVLTDNTMAYYQRSSGYLTQYTRLKGSYQEAGEDIKYSAYDFTIYEPNADLHPSGENGSYKITRPVEWDTKGNKTADIGDRVSVQCENRWTKYEGTDCYIEQAFKAATANKSFDSAEEAGKSFYGDILGGGLLSYVDKGSFIQSTSELYRSAAGDTVSKEDMAALARSGATEDVCIAQLEKNVPQRVRMFVWIEGQDADCMAISENVSFALNIELAGSNSVKQ